MLICHCNVISEREIEGIVREFLAADPWAIIVPVKVYGALGKRGRCCNCFPNVVDIIGKVTHEYHRELADASAGAMEAPGPTAERRKRVGVGHERRSTGHRAA